MITNFSKLIKQIDTFRGKWGYFYEHDLKKLSEINKYVIQNFKL